MQLDIQARGFTLTDALRNHCERRLRFALGPIGGRLRSVSVRLADVNGPRGGVDKRCTLRATASGMAPVVIAHDETDIYVAIDRASDRLARSLTRRIQKSWRDRRDLSSMFRSEPSTETGISAH
jgi:putative sigma-54 modulation protein